MLQQDTIDFFSELRENNHKEWFDLNRKRYELVKKNYHLLVQQFIESMQIYDSRLSNLQVKDCVFRINRDIRFSKDKTPYKTHLAILLSPEGKKMNGAGYYIHIAPQEESFIAGGIYMPPPEFVKKMRAEIAGYYEELDAIFENKDFNKVFNGWDNEKKLTLVNAPKGYEDSHPALTHLKLKSYTVTHTLPQSILTDPNGVKNITQSLKLLKPLIDFINTALKENE